MRTYTELLASYWTIAGEAFPHTDKEYSPFDFKDRVEAVAQAGFTGIGIWHADLERTLQKRNLKEMKRILDDNGIMHVELEFLTDWFLEGERKPMHSARWRDLHGLGPEDVLALTGDYPKESAGSETKANFELDS